MVKELLNRWKRARENKQRRMGYEPISDTQRIFQSFTDQYLNYISPQFTQIQQTLLSDELSLQDPNLLRTLQVPILREMFKVGRNNYRPGHLYKADSTQDQDEGKTQVSLRAVGYSQDKSLPPFAEIALQRTDAAGEVSKIELSYKKERLIDILNFLKSPEEKTPAEQEIVHARVTSGGKSMEYALTLRDGKPYELIVYKPDSKGHKIYRRERDIEFHYDEARKAIRRINRRFR